MKQIFHPLISNKIQGKGVPWQKKGGPVRVELKAVQILSAMKIQKYMAKKMFICLVKKDEEVHDEEDESDKKAWEWATPIPGHAQQMANKFFEEPVAVELCGEVLLSSEKCFASGSE